jgi:hypothetical protein
MKKNCLPAIKPDFLAFWFSGIWLAVFLITGLCPLHAQSVEAVTDADFIIEGSSVQERLGQRLAMGDINGDSIDDLILCTRFLDPLGRQRAGGVYVIFGSSTPRPEGTLSLESESADLTIFGATAEDRLGLSYVSPHPALAIGDLNGDGTEDLILAAPRATPEGRKQAGIVYVLFGRESYPPTIDLAEQTADAVIYGATPLAQTGAAITLGDMDGDGYKDLVLGSPLFLRGSRFPYGRIDILPGGPSWNTRTKWDLATEQAGWTILGGFEQEQLGDSMALGDFTGDGIEDLMVGVSAAHLERLDNRGKILLFYGFAGSLEQRITDLKLEDETAAPTFFGLKADGRFGHAVGIFDLTGGPEKDLVISAPEASPKNPQPDKTNYRWGTVYVVEGRSDFPEKTDFAFVPADAIIYGTTNDDRFGYSLAGGHIDSNRKTDLVAGSFRAERVNQYPKEGLVTILPAGALPFGPGTEQPVSFIGPAFRIWGGRLRERLGTSLAAGDFNGDGVDDIAIGAPASPSFDRGRCYLFYGERFELEEIRLPAWIVY